MSWTSACRPFALAVSIAPAACTVVGPDFVSPAMQAPAAYTALANEGFFSVGGQLRSDWWAQLGLGAIDPLIAEALAKNPTLLEADATLDAAIAMRDAVFGGSGVAVDGQAGWERGRINATSFGFGGFPSRTISRYSTGIGVSYDLDLFGGAAREREMADASVLSEAYRLSAARMTVAAQIASRVIEAAGIQAEIAIAEEIIADDEATLALVERAIVAGASGEIDRVRAQSQLAVDRALLPPLRERLAHSQHALSLLTGRDPSQLQDLGLDLTSLGAEVSLPVAIPSDLVHGRPDILAAEAVLHAAVAQIGVRTADLYPRISLSARLVQTSLSPEDLFSYDASGWSFGPSVSLPLFHNGALEANVRRAEAEARRADARYRAVVLRAFGEVADAMASVQSTREEFDLQNLARAAAEEALRLERRNYEVGGGRLLDVLAAQRQAGLSRLSALRSQVRHVQATVRLSSATAFSEEALEPAAGPDN